MFVMLFRGTGNQDVLAGESLASESTQQAQYDWCTLTCPKTCTPGKPFEIKLAFKNIKETTQLWKYTKLTVLLFWSNEGRWGDCLGQFASAEITKEGDLTLKGTFELNDDIEDSAAYVHVNAVLSSDSKFTKENTAAKFMGPRIAVVKEQASATQSIKAKATSLSSENLIGEPAFASFSPKGIAAGWHDNTSWAPVKVDYSAMNGSDGRQAQCIRCTEFKGGAVLFCHHNIPVEKGRNYSITVRMRSQDKLGVEVVVRKPGQPYTTYLSKIFHVDQEWKEFSFEGTAPEDDPAAAFFFKFISTGTLCIDKASCVATSKTGVRGITLLPPTTPIPPSLFGMHMHSGFVLGLPGHKAVKYDYYKSGKSCQWPNVPFGAWRLYGSNTKWSELEPSKGEWKWEELDTYLKLAQEHGVDVLYTFGHAPKWAAARPDENSAFGPKAKGGASEPKDMDDWRNYIRAVVSHCKGKVRYYEGWNEPNNNAVSCYFTGTKDKLIELQKEIYEITKSIDPDAMVVSPSIVSDYLYLDYLLEHGMDRYCDILGFHFYSVPEGMQRGISVVQSLMAAYKVSKPLWDTEAGWPIRTSKRSNVISAENMYAVTADTAGEYFARAYILNWAMGVERYYWYAWDDGVFGIIEYRDGEPTVAVKAYSTTYQWLVGSTMEKCERDESGNWTAVLRRADIGKFRVVWAEKGASEIDISSWGAKQADDLYGNMTTLNGAKTLKISSSPQRVY